MWLQGVRCLTFTSVKVSMLQKAAHKMQEALVQCGFTIRNDRLKVEEITSSQPHSTIARLQCFTANALSSPWVMRGQAWQLKCPMSRSCSPSWTAPVDPESGLQTLNFPSSYMLLKALERLSMVPVETHAKVEKLISEELNVLLLWHTNDYFWDLHVR